MRAVVKVGGSLLRDGPRLRAVLADCAGRSCVVVPGGGPDADAVRRAQAVEGFSDGEAHRRALDAMGCTAERFRALAPGLVLSRAPWEAPATGPALVWDPALLRGGHPAIPETWDVTSDSLSLWLAARIGAPSCTLVKSADAPLGCDPEALARSGLVDAAFPVFARSFRGAIAILGPNGPVPVLTRRAA